MKIILLVIYIWSLCCISAESQTQYLQGGVSAEDTIEQPTCQPTQQPTQQQLAAEAMTRCINGFNSVNSGNVPIVLLRGLGKLARRHAPVITADIGDQLSAIGAEFQEQGIVLHIDPASDLYGKARVGDTILLFDNENPTNYTRERRNYGLTGAVVKVKVLHQSGGIEYFMCRRKPIAEFNPSYRAGMLSPN